ncbi:MAG TPA: DUF6194 family protein [Chloroflexia bacterium]|nr:DUF6194 family protein [Chloroflexia bacterium]
MNEASIISYITNTFEGVGTESLTSDMFFFYDPPGVTADHKFPFATLVTNDNYDSVSKLSRPSVYRLNIGVGKETFRSLFGSQPFGTHTDEQGADIDGVYDYTTLDKIMPHPVYGKMYWVCVLSPSDATFEAEVKPLLAEAYELDVKKHTKRASRG